MPLRRPPAGVAFVAFTHGLTGLVIVAASVLLLSLTRNLPRFGFGFRTYVSVGGLAGLYLLTAVLVWFGWPFGRLLSRICGLLYLPRPAFGFRIWDTMDSPEFRDHFRRPRMETPPENSPSPPGR
ncbi:MAG: hypothetical protein HZC55_24315 [Verrucomicrobia bacterium]|jgi:hypothetical protein|nr:hypothetical protein [Verrucomicrobiota bacterium]